MRHVLSILCVCMLVFPAPVFAQSLSDLLKNQPDLEFVPKPDPEQCDDAKCFDLEDYKLYLQMRAQYVWLFKVHTGLMPGLLAELKKIDEAHAEEAEVQKERADRYKDAYDELFPKYVNSIKEAERAKATSIFGGGLTWVILTGVAGITLGLIGGFWLSGELSDSNSGS